MQAAGFVVRSASRDFAVAIPSMSLCVLPVLSRLQTSFGCQLRSRSLKTELLLNSFVA